MAKIVTITNDTKNILRQKSEKVEKNDITNNKVRKIAADMLKTMIKLNGAGFAAPQIGFNLRIIVISSKDGAIYMFNPEITKKSWAKEWDEEGCLSVPGVHGQVKRHRKVECNYFDEHGQKMKISAQGLMARVIQHEIDHLDGIIFIDKAKDIENNGQSYE